MIIFRCIRKIAKTDDWLRLARARARPHGRTPTQRIFMKFNILRISGKSVEETQVILKSNKNNGYLI
jgi:hypothetical protein